jgi:hypothetical protein
LTFELGPAAGNVTSALLPAPPGWTQLASKAALAGQWNLDLGRLMSYLGPCVKALGVERDIANLRSTGIRAGRAIVQSIDPDNKSGTGALSLDLEHAKAISELLDKVPMRSTLEKDRTWGGVAGHHLSIPFGPSIDYIVDEHRAIVAMGDGVMDQAMAAGTPGPRPVFAIDVNPPMMPADAWAFLIKLAGANPRRVVDRLMRWHDGHLALVVDGSALVFEATGNRR